MKSIRIEVKNKPHIPDASARGALKDIIDLKIKHVRNVERIDVYTLEGDISKKETRLLADELFADKISQTYSIRYTANPKPIRGAKTIEIAYNPGVMDPVRESAVKAINDIGIKSVSDVKTSKKYILHGKINEKETALIAEKLFYNKIIQHVIKDTDDDVESKSNDIKTYEVPIIDSSDKELVNISKEGQLYLNLSEMKSVKEYFKSIGRNPTDCELETIAQTWSEHCKHKTMMGDIIYNGKKINNLLKSTVMKATAELNKPWCVSVFKDNAGIIKFDSEYNICFKVETHNHPSALEPYGGAETGVGGVIRDCMGTGRGAKPIANTDIFCFGYPDMRESLVPKGALHPKRVFKGVVSGVKDYGNKMGIPTVNGAICFDDRYTGNPLVFCGNIGIIPAKFSTKKVSPGDIILSVGGRTGRDGIHGATFSSGELTRKSETVSSTAVQIGNPITEKKMLDTLLKARDLGLYEAITDCGAGGFSSAVGEMGEHTGALVNLEKAPLKYNGLKPWEIWVSEAQERMVIAVRPAKLNRIMEIFRDENVEATVIGKFTNDKKLRIKYKNHDVACLDMAFLHKGIPRKERLAVWKNKKEKNIKPAKEIKDLSKALKNILSRWQVASKEWIIRQYDHEVQGGTVLKPLSGLNDDGPQNAAVIKPVLDSEKGIAISNGINPCYGDIDPYWMTASAIDEALRQIVSVGGDLEKIAILDNFCWGNTENPEQLGALVRAAQACYDMAKIYGTPFISGKDSLNNEFNTGKKTISIPYTILISAIGIIDNVEKTITQDIKEAGNLLYILGLTKSELGASQYFLYLNIKNGIAPKVNPVTSRAIMKKLHSSVNKGLVRSIHDSSEGGIAVAISEMLFAGGLGAEIRLRDLPREKNVKRDDFILFSESNSRFIVEVEPNNKNAFEKIMRGIPFAVIGKVTKEPYLAVQGLNGEIIIKSHVNNLKASWKSPIQEVMHG